MRLVGHGPFWVPAQTEEDAPEWEPTAEGRERTRLALEPIDEHHAATYRACALCGQRAIHLDDFGLCSKISPPHAKWRNQVRKREKTGKQ